MPLFPLWPSISLSWREKRGENGSPMEGKVLGRTRALCTLLKVNGYKELLNMRCVWWVEGAHRGPGGVTWGQNIWELRDLQWSGWWIIIRNLIQLNPPEKQQMALALSMWLWPRGCPMALLLISGCGALVWLCLGHEGTARAPALLLGAGQEGVSRDGTRGQCWGSGRLCQLRALPPPCPAQRMWFHGTSRVPGLSTLDLLLHMHKTQYCVREFPWKETEETWKLFSVVNIYTFVIYTNTMLKVQWLFFPRNLLLPLKYESRNSLEIIRERSLG